MIRDRRGAGVAEYALLLFLVIAAVGITFRFMGNRVKGAGDKTQEQFQGSGGSGGGGPTAKNGSGGAAGAGSAGGGDTTGGSGGAAGGGGKNAAAGGGGGHGGGASGTHASSGGPSGGGDEEAAEDTGTPIWKIIGGVIVVLFLVGGYFAFRKQKSSG